MLGANFDVVSYWIGNLIYLAQGLMALWAAYCVVTILRRIKETSFRSEEEQDQFLDALEDALNAGDTAGAAELCQGDRRAVPQLAALGLANLPMGHAKIRSLLAERFQRDVLADLDYRTTWVYTAIKSEPMLGLHGTVIGMMGAFGKLGARQSVSPELLATDISLALITTAVGLTIAIPLVIATGSIIVRTRKLEDLVGTGLGRFLEILKTTSARRPLGAKSP